MDAASDKNTEAIIEEASQWLVRLSAPDATLKERREFIAWLKRSPVHLAEYLRLEATWADLAAVDGGRTMDVAELLAAEDSNVVELSSAAAASARPRRAWQFANVAAAGFVIALVAILWLVPLTRDRYVTGVGEQQTIRLADGSTVVLNTDTKLRVALTADVRRVDLLQGEALFNVAKDAARPFRVFSDETIAQAVGTSFVVRKKADEIVVTVLEGEVAVARVEQQKRQAADEIPPEALRLVAGVRADVVSQEIHTSAVPNLAAVTAWKSGRLIFEGETLADVAAEFNRYNDLQIVLEDPALSGERLSGVFDADKPQALVRFLERSNVVEPAQMSGRQIILVPRR